MSSLKILNDPIYGFITLPGDVVFSLIQHPYFQRLRRIRQLGMTHLVYPGAHHTRFHHALGAMHLMQQALDVLVSKGHTITGEEKEGALIAILLHDIGHGPFSHALEDSIVNRIRHEEMSWLFMDRLNRHFDGRLDLAIRIFRDEYPKKFLHQLVSSQLDVDRLDYLSRDSFFAGVSEGIISQDRIIKMMDVHEGNLAVEAKGIYSVEKFLVARRLMYWQVYLHKTVVSAECMLINILRRARELSGKGGELFSTPAFRIFLTGHYSREDFLADESLLDTFSLLDDSDITASIKVWTGHSDPILGNLCQRAMNRDLFKIKIQNRDFPDAEANAIREKVMAAMNISESDLHYYFIRDKLVNQAYLSEADRIRILFKDGTVKDIAEAADTINLKALSGPVEKFYMCFPKEIA